MADQEQKVGRFASAIVHRPEPDGLWVRYEDHQAKVAELEEELTRLRGYLTRASMALGGLEFGGKLAAHDMDLADAIRALREQRCCAVSRVGKHQADCPRILYADASEERDAALGDVQELLEAIEPYAVDCGVSCGPEDCKRLREVYDRPRHRPFSQPKGDRA